MFNTFDVSEWKTSSAANNVCIFVTKNKTLESYRAGSSSWSSELSTSYVRLAFSICSFALEARYERLCKHLMSYGLQISFTCILRRILDIATFCEWEYISFDSTLRQVGLHQVSFFVKKIWQKMYPNYVSPTGSIYWVTL